MNTQAAGFLQVNIEMSASCGFFSLTTSIAQYGFVSIVARAFLEQCSGVKEESGDGTSAVDKSSQDIHILVTSGALIPSLVKCLLFRLDTFLKHENGKLGDTSFNGIQIHIVVATLDTPPCICISV